MAQSVKNLPAMEETWLWPGLETSPGEGNGNPLLYLCLGSPMDWGAWWATFHGVTRVGHDLVTKIPPPRVQGSLTPWKEKKDATPAGPKKCSISQSGASATMAHFTLCTMSKHHQNKMLLWLLFLLWIIEDLFLCFKNFVSLYNTYTYL